MATGETINITMESAGRYRLELKLDGLIGWGHANRTSFTFLTTTFAPDLGLTVDERVECRNDFIHELRRVFREAGLPMKYVWVYSLQLDRFLSGDTAATPYHYLLACPAGTLPDQQPVTGPDGKDYWETRADGTLLTLAGLEGMWCDKAGRSLGTINCGTVRSLPAARAYMLKNEQEAEAHHVRRSRRFNGSRLGTYGFPRGLRREVDAEREAHPERDYNRVSRKNNRATMRVVSGDGEIVHEKVVMSPWTVDPARWRERKCAIAIAELRRGLRWAVRRAMRRSMLARQSCPVPVQPDSPVQDARGPVVKPVVRLRMRYAAPAPAPAPVKRSPRVWRFSALPLDIPGPTPSVASSRSVEPAGAPALAVVLDAVIDQSSAPVLRASTWHDSRRVRPAIDSMNGALSDLKQAPSPAGASLPPRPATCGDAFGSEHHAPDRVVPAASSPASSPAPARSHARCASGHDAQAIAQVDAPAERALPPAQGDIEAKLAGYMRRLGLHLDPGDAGSGTPDMSRENVSITNMLRDMSAPGVDAQAVAPAKHARALARNNQEVQS